jgi:hypothetical protein
LEFESQLSNIYAIFNKNISINIAVRNSQIDSCISEALNPKSYLIGTLDSEFNNIRTPGSIFDSKAAVRPRVIHIK